MARVGLYTIFGYLSGSILFAYVFGRLFRGKDITEDSADGNPGTANAFMYGGFVCGVLTLCGDLLKGFLPVYLYLRGTEINSYGLALVLAAPVAGHIFSIFHGFRGGKGIAVSFGCLLGLAPEMTPVLILAGMFLLFSLVIRITPHYDRTIWVYRCSAVCMLLFIKKIYIVTGFLVISLLINAHMYFSNEKREKRQVRLLWTH